MNRQRDEERIQKPRYLPQGLHVPELVGLDPEPRHDEVAEQRKLDAEKGTDGEDRHGEQGKISVPADEKTSQTDQYQHSIQVREQPSAASDPLPEDLNLQ